MRNGSGSVVGEMKCMIVVVDDALLFESSVNS